MYIGLDGIILFVVLFLISLYYLYLSRKQIKDIESKHEKSDAELWKKINALDTKVFEKSQAISELEEELQKEAESSKESLKSLSMRHAIREVRLTFNCSKEEAEHIWVILEYHVDEDIRAQFYNEYSITKRKKIYQKLQNQEF